VLLLERRELATATTPRAAGLIRNLNLKKGQTPLKTLTIEAISFLGDELEETLQWHQVGGLLVAESEANMMHLETLERHAIEHSQKFQWIDRTDAEEMVPWLDGYQPESLLCFRMTVSSIPTCSPSFMQGPPENMAHY